ncbi:EpsG family protein [Cyanobium sp. Alchichica 3B3-8F6]|uniref:EpsG family protein n=1 Tax=Cyanobium sp. Alchichica 3B3-8F6 TaxID=2823696 RepID=UPI0020CBDB20|nr:EpsG family protein [Cyanobium sp. Alchichica 3B3-8F6]MCP9883373.1 EpsG family protein [Cyanobium sp. Alchichica 3B3-8F6]
MIAYFLTWAWIAWFALFGRRHWSLLTTTLVWSFFSFFIGLRVEIGVDWFNYLPYLDQQLDAPLGFALASKDPGYAMLNWVAVQLDWGVFGVNYICAAIFSAGLVLFCRQQPYPWLALALAFPYLIVVVAMGYTRQGVAIGIELLALLALQRDRLLQFLAWIGLAATFHATALSMLVLPISSLGQRFGRLSGLVSIAFLIGTGYGLLRAFLVSSIETYQTVYLEAEYQSQGAIIRVILVLLPALIFLWNRRQFPVSPSQGSIYTLMAWLAVAASIGLVVSPSSTAVDRVALYLLPLQIVVGSHLPLIRWQGLGPGTWRQLLVLSSFALLSIWLLFAANSAAWLPYYNLLFEF